MKKIKLLFIQVGWFPKGLWGISFFDKLHYISDGTWWLETKKIKPVITHSVNELPKDLERAIKEINGKPEE